MTVTRNADNLNNNTTTLNGEISSEKILCLPEPESKISDRLNGASESNQGRSDVVTSINVSQETSGHETTPNKTVIESSCTENRSNEQLDNSDTKIRELCVSPQG
ncbi:hypothetical protein ACFE04_018995 [Oxalis oulophora]